MKQSFGKLKTDLSKVFTAKTKRKILFQTAIYFRTFLIIGMVFVILFPFFLRLSYALRSPIDNTDPTVFFIPAHYTLNNFRNAFRALDYGTLFFNTISLSLFSAVFQVLSAAFSGYAFAKLKFRGSNLLFYLAVFTVLIPYETLHISRMLFFTYYPFFGTYLIGNVFSIFIMSVFGQGIRSGIFIFIFRQYFLGISEEIEDSAHIDGAGIFRTFWNVSLPSARGAVLTVFVFAFVWQWNDFYFPNFFNLASNGFRVFSTQVLSRRLMSNNASSLLLMTPLLIGYLCVQKLMVDRFERSGIVG